MNTTAFVTPAMGRLPSRRRAGSVVGSAPLHGKATSSRTGSGNLSAARSARVVAASSSCATDKNKGNAAAGDGEQAADRVVAMPAPTRRRFLSAAALSALAAAVAELAPAPGGTGPSSAAAAAGVVALRPQPWAQVPVDADTTLFDLSFSPTDPKHGFLVGTRGTVLESTDGGNSWIPRTFASVEADEELNYRFEVVTFRGSEGWVIGKPSLLLYTADNGKSWERVSLSPKLPGEPVAITALGEQTAEMTTSAGAVYITQNAGKNWKAQVRETIDATLNRTISSGVTGASYFTGSIVSVLRDSSGGYLAVSSRGNFFLTWQPGQDFWVPHARDSSRRIQAMGFVSDSLDNGIWMSTRGGGLAFSEKAPDLNSTELIPFKKVDIKSGGYGILDVAFRPGTDEVWAAIGGGSLMVSNDGGTTWQRANLPRIGATIYKIKFFSSDLAFALGSSGVLLKYNPNGMLA
jgi:photosystem II stability/assembly factor-like uncharacterized protein